MSTYKNREKRHGRIEIREYYFSYDIDWLEKNEWTELKKIGRVKPKVIEGENKFTRYYILRKTALSLLNQTKYVIF